jgi:hypothetical protein
MAIHDLILILTIVMVMAIGYGHPLVDFVIDYCYGYWLWLLDIVDGYKLLL